MAPRWIRTAVRYGTHCLSSAIGSGSGPEYKPELIGGEEALCYVSPDTLGYVMAFQPIVRFRYSGTTGYL